MLKQSLTVGYSMRSVCISGQEHEVENILHSCGPLYATTPDPKIKPGDHSMLVFGGILCVTLGVTLGVTAAARGDTANKKPEEKATHKHY